MPLITLRYGVQKHSTIEPKMIYSVLHCSSSVRSRMGMGGTWWQRRGKVPWGTRTQQMKVVLRTCRVKCGNFLCCATTWQMLSMQMISGLYNMAGTYLNGRKMPTQILHACNMI
jgi:hypothetical protein